MSKVETQEEADRLNETATYGPYRAANGHLMVAPLRFPSEDLVVDRRGHCVNCPPCTIDHGRYHCENHRGSYSDDRDYVIGDEIRYTTWDAWCAPECNHDSPPEDW